MKSEPVTLPAIYNYIGAFLTFRCPHKCPYCINYFGRTRDNPDWPELPAAEWIDFFRRLAARDVPVTLQGGEPGLHSGFLEILKETLKTHPVDVLTTLLFDLEAFAREITPESINRAAPYAPIRVSYHPGQTPLEPLLKRFLFLQERGYRIGLYAVTHPENEQAIADLHQTAAELKIDFRTKPFLGEYGGRLYGEYAYPDACNAEQPRHCECAPSELLIDPAGNIHICHHHLYNRLAPQANITDTDLSISDAYQSCEYYGFCNPCDVKVKNNRFQQFGHVSMRIRNIQ